MTVLFLLCALHQKVGSVFPRVVANRLQFFEYESLIVHCEGLKGEQLTCRTTRKLESTGSSCIINNAFPEDSGEYWCETGAVKSSNSVSITVTAGSVILESPVLPVAEGDAVTLSCRNKTTSSNITADFYKDGLLIRSSSTGSIIILSVSNSDEGLYKCRIPDGGESAESWLTVRETSPSSSSSAPWIVVTILLMVLLLAVGLLHFGRDYWHRDEDELMSQALYCTLGPGNTQHLEPSASTNPSTKENALYSNIP